MPPSSWRTSSRAASEPAPDSLVVPLGSGGTAAGLMVGLALAGLPTRVVGVRVVPRLVANRRRVMRLARATAARFAKLAGVAPPVLDENRLDHRAGAVRGRLRARNGGVA